MSVIEAISRGCKGTLSDGTVRYVFDISPQHVKEAAELFGMPGAPVALARLTQEAAKISAQNEAIQKGGLLSKWLAMRYSDQDFRDFMYSQYDIDGNDDLDAACKDILEIESKRELDNDEQAANRFHELIRLPYSQWLHGMRK